MAIEGTDYTERNVCQPGSDDTPRKLPLPEDRPESNWCSKGEEGRRDLAAASRVLGQWGTHWYWWGVSMLNELDELKRKVAELEERCCKDQQVPPLKFLTTTGKPPKSPF